MSLERVMDKDRRYEARRELYCSEAREGSGVRDKLLLYTEREGGSN